MRPTAGGAAEHARDRNFVQRSESSSKRRKRPAKPLRHMPAPVGRVRSGQEVAAELHPAIHPLVGKQLCESALRMAADALEDVAQVGERVDTEPLVGGDKAGQHCSRPSPVIAAPKGQFLRPTAIPCREIAHGRVTPQSDTLSSCQDLTSMPRCGPLRSPVGFTPVDTGGNLKLDFHPL